MNKLVLIILITGFSLIILLSVIFLIWFPISPLNTIFNLSIKKTISGNIYDCETKEPIGNAIVTMSGTGWAWDNGPIWNRTYKSSTKVNVDGTFDLVYNVGTTLNVEKEGYLNANKYTQANNNLSIGIVKMTEENKNESPTYDCKIRSQCIKTKIIEGVETTWDSCANPELYKDIEK